MRTVISCVALAFVLLPVPSLAQARGTAAFKIDDVGYRGPVFVDPEGKNIAMFDCFTPEEGPTDCDVVIRDVKTGKVTRKFPLGEIPLDPGDGVAMAGLRAANDFLARAGYQASDGGAVDLAGATRFEKAKMITTVSDRTFEGSLAKVRNPKPRCCPWKTVQGQVFQAAGIIVAYVDSECTWTETPGPCRCAGLAGACSSGESGTVILRAVPDRAGKAK